MWSEGSLPASVLLLAAMLHRPVQGLAVPCAHTNLSARSFLPPSRKQAKMQGQFKGLMKGAQRGAKAGRKNRLKDRRP